MIGSNFSMHVLASGPMKKSIGLILALALVTAAPVQAAAPANTTQTVVMTLGDILLMRPFSFAATVIGFTVFVVGYPLIALNDNDTAWEDLVMKPGRATFTRCIGCDMIEEPKKEEPESEDPSPTP
jgi:hypothetical protein